NAGRAPGVPELSVRIGVHTGLVVVGGASGGAGSAKGIAVGDVPVIASRIQTVAQPGTVVLSEATAQLIGTELRLDDLGPPALQGLSAPVRLYTVAAAEVAVQAADAPVEGGVVGREVELATLHG